MSRPRATEINCKLVVTNWEPNKRAMRTRSPRVIMTGELQDIPKAGGMEL